MVQYTLKYFDVRGLGEAIRLLFHYVGQSFEDVRFTHEQWPALKPTFFYGKVPVLEVDGKELAQSGAILRYLANKFGLAGKDEWEKAKLDEIFDFYKDMYNELATYIYVKLGLREGNAAQLRKDVFMPGVERMFPLVVKLLAQSGSGFFTPSGPTYVDFVMAEYFDNLLRHEPQALDGYPEIAAHIKKVFGLPQLQQYMSTRKA